MKLQVVDLRYAMVKAISSRTVIVRLRCYALQACGIMAYRF